MLWTRRSLTAVLLVLALSVAAAASAFQLPPITPATAVAGRRHAAALELEVVVVAATAPPATAASTLDNDDQVSASSSSSTTATGARRSPRPRGSSSATSTKGYYNHQAWLRGWQTCRTEECYVLEGMFPPDLSGTFFQNGPAQFEIGNELVIHPFDGQGMIRAVTFDKGKAWFRNKFVQTKEHLEEVRAQKVLYRGVFGTAKNQGHWWSNALDMRRKHVANTHVLYHNKQLLALWEGARPYQVDPTTLETLGESSDYSDRYAAHPKVDLQSNSICGFALYFDWKSPTTQHELRVMEHDLSSGKLLYQQSYTVPGLPIGHDMAVTPNYFCFLRPPGTFDPLPYVMGQKGPAQCFQFDASKPSQLLLVPRRRRGRLTGWRGDDTPDDELISINVPPGFCFHFVNAYEKKNGHHHVIVDALIADKMYMADTSSNSYPTRPLWETVDMTEELTPFRVTRFVVDSKRQRLAAPPRVLNTKAATADFPVVHPAKVGQPYQYAYLCASSSEDESKLTPPQGLIKMDSSSSDDGHQRIDEWFPEPHEFVSEVVFCPRRCDDDDDDDGAKEDDGYLVGYLYNGIKHESSVVVLDAQDLKRGPIAQAQLRNPLPHALHGTFVQGLVVPPSLTPPRQQQVQAQ